MKSIKLNSFYNLNNPAIKLNEILIEIQIWNYEIPTIELNELNELLTEIQLYNNEIHQIKFILQSI